MNLRGKEGDIIALSDSNYFVYTQGGNSRIESFFWKSFRIFYKWI